MTKSNFSITVFDAEYGEYMPLRVLDNIDFNRLIETFNVARIKITLSDGNVVIIDKLPKELNHG